MTSLPGDPAGSKPTAQDDQTPATTRWWHEDELVHQRLTWLLSAHALLVAGYAWLRYRIADVKLEAVGKDEAPRKLSRSVLDYISTLQDLMTFVAYIGVFVSLFATVGVVAACVAQNQLKTDYPNAVLGVSRFTTNLGRISALSLPVACIWAWGYMTVSAEQRLTTGVMLSLLSVAIALFSIEPRGMRRT